jgi:large subunit ribosomal protein L15
MPLQRRLPKVGFNSRLSAVTAEIRLQELAKVDAEIVDLDALLAANLISKNIKRAKIIDSGKIEKAVSVKGLGMTKGARAAIEAAGGKVLED